MAVLLVLLATGGAAMIPTRPRLTLVASVPVGVNGHMMITGPRLIVIDRIASHYEISAFSLPGGERIWRTRMAGSGAGPTIVTTPSSVIVMMAGSAESSSAQAFNIRTGKLLWQEPDIAAILHSDDDLFLFSSPADNNTSSLRVIDSASGEVRWSATIPPDCQTRLVNDGAATSSPGLIELCVNSQQLRVLDADTGEIRARVTVNLFPIYRTIDSADLHLATPGVNAIDNLVIVLHDNYPTATLDAFNARDLTPVWSNVATTPSSFLYGCGPDICMIGGGIQVVVDPVTGKWIPGATPASIGRGAGVESSIARDGAPTTLVIVPKGQTAAKAGRGAVADYVNPATEGQTVSVPAAADGLTWVARQVMTATGLMVEPLQLLHGVRADACVPISTYVACSTSGGTLKLWRVPG